MSLSSYSHASSLVNQQIVLQLNKFSYCTTLIEARLYPWTHVVGQGDLMLVFDTVRRLGIAEQMVEKRVMKVTERGKLLESVELESLRALMEGDRRPGFRQGVIEANQSLSVMFKPSENKVAFRYRVSDREFRRIQFLFQSSTGLEVCMQEIMQFGLPMKNMDQERPATTNLAYGYSVYDQRQSIAPRPHAQEMSYLPYSNSPPQSAGSYPASQQHGHHSPTPSQMSQANMMWRLPHSQQHAPAAHPANTTTSVHPPSLEYASRPPLFSPADPRPNSAPQFQSQRPLTESYSIEEMMPPVRVLPFKKPALSPSTTPVQSSPDPSNKATPTIKKTAMGKFQLAVPSSDPLSTSSLTGKPTNQPTSKRKQPTKQSKPRKKPAETKKTQKRISAAITKPLTEKKKSRKVPEKTPAPSSHSRATQWKEATPSLRDERAAKRHETRATPVAPSPSPLTPTSPRGRRQPGAPLAERSNNARLARRPGQKSQGVQTDPMTPPHRYLSTGVQTNESTHRLSEAPTQDENTVDVAVQTTPTRKVSRGTQTDSTTPELVSMDSVMERMDECMRKYNVEPTPRPPPSINDQLAEFSALTEGQRRDKVSEWMVEAAKSEEFLSLFKIVDESWQKVLYE